jgi:hypothetical protein
MPREYVKQEPKLPLLVLLLAHHVRYISDVLEPDLHLLFLRPLT